jgi:hypothetical protein
MKEESESRVDTSLKKMVWKMREKADPEKCTIITVLLKRSCRAEWKSEVHG